MPLYKIAQFDADKNLTIRLVKASSKAAAFSYVVTPMFVVTVITDPTESAEIAASGVKLETAGEIAEDKAPSGASTSQAEAQAAMLAEALANGKGAAHV